VLLNLLHIETQHLPTLFQRNNCKKLSKKNHNLQQDSVTVFFFNRGRNFSVLGYEPVLKIDPYQTKAWNSAKEIERQF
jgi:hypothetical protein